MPISNTQIAEAFETMADLLEFEGANPFRTRAYRNAARVIRDMTESLAEIVDDDPARLEVIDGIGKAVAEKSVALVRTGRIEQLEKLKSRVPESVLAILRIPGVGPKKAAALFQELGVTTLEELRAACETHRVRELKGFGAKTEATILQGLAQAAAGEVRMLWADADDIVRAVLEHMRGCPAVGRLSAAGSYRRGKETVGDLDLLVTSDDVPTVMDHFAEFPGIGETLARGDTKMSIRLANGPQVDLRVVPRQSFGAALQYFTGSKEHNVELRGRARQMGMKVNEYGVFRVEEEGGETSVAGEEEADVYAALGLPHFPPEIREARFEFEWAEEGKLPRLIEQADLRGDLHMHTTASDGRDSLEAMAEAARALGYEYIAITDHSPRVSMAHGLSAERLRAQWDEIEELNDRLEGFRVLKGVECDILEDGRMDHPDAVLADADWVIASIHYGQNQSREQITDRILGALANPYVCAIAHPTGRLMGKRQRKPYEVDLEAVFQAAREHRKFLELNASKERLDLSDVHCLAAHRAGVLLTLNTDAHRRESLGNMRWGILQARRAGLSPGAVINTRPWSEVLELLGRN